MAKKTKRRVKKVDESRSLLVRDNDGNAYFISPERLGPALVDATLNRAIDKFMKDHDNQAMFELNFAIMIGERNSIVYAARNAKNASFSKKNASSDP